MRKRVVTTLIAMVLATVFTAGAADFAGADSIKERFKARLPVINDLKAKRIVGENNKGFLDFIGGQKAKQAVVAAENSDRMKVYAHIAKQQGSTPDTVGVRRAIQIAGKARPGEMLQNASGQWYKK